MLLSLAFLTLGSFNINVAIIGTIYLIIQFRSSIALIT